MGQKDRLSIIVIIFDFSGRFVLFGFIGEQLVTGYSACPGPYNLITPHQIVTIRRIRSGLQECLNGISACRDITSKVADIPAAPLVRKGYVVIVRSTTAHPPRLKGLPSCIPDLSRHIANDCVKRAAATVVYMYFVGHITPPPSRSRS